MTDVIEMTDEAAEAKALRAALVKTLTDDGVITSGAVAAAVGAVPRHLFTPEVALAEAYGAYTSVVTKRGPDGRAMSSVSEPHVQAFMLEQAQIAPGMRVLEIGSGGYNAALIAELVGEAGEVTTVDIDPMVTDRARGMLAAAGYDRVRVVLADADAGLPDGAPYDRILVTVGAWDIPPAWTEQLAEGGRLLVPLRVRGLTRVIAFEDRGNHLESVSERIFGFVPMQGEGAHEAHTIVLAGGEIRLRFDDAAPADPDALAGAVGTERAEVWTGAHIGRQELLQGIEMYMATAMDGFCVLSLDRDKDSGLITLPGKKAFAMAAVEGGSFAYLTSRASQDPDEVEFGVHAYGPGRDALAEDMAGQVRIWSKCLRGRGTGASFALYPAATPDDQLPGGRVVDKKHRRVLISWPEVTAGQDA
ncbi:methyltransferase, FxLD system [Actinospica robiniae]|uniref:methyltransferase, FxLD system n=1 Tax=Actinospica robiniae TaxID=304901 RepID=UPI0003F681B3|nr:methyltransferase, FxLD system [Actinospica robiniae]